jgi:hypothetical protein
MNAGGNLDEPDTKPSIEHSSLLILPIVFGRIRRLFLLIPESLDVLWQGARTSSSLTCQS